MPSKTENLYERLTGVDSTKMEPRPSDLILSKWIQSIRGGTNHLDELERALHPALYAKNKEVEETINTIAELGDWDGQVRELLAKGSLTRDSVPCPDWC